IFCLKMKFNETRNQTQFNYDSFCSWDYVSVVCIVLAILTILLHCFGIWLLVKTKHKIKEHIEIISLSFNLICFGVSAIVHVTLLTELPNYESVAAICAHANLIPFYSGMILLTLQRFFAIWLHLRYESSWVFLKRTHRVVVSWLVGGMILVLHMLFASGVIKSVAWLFYLVSVLPQIGFFSTIIIFVFTYTYIYTKYRQSTQTTRNSMYKNRKSKLFTPVFICGSFFFFGTVPHFVDPFHREKYLFYVWFLLDGISNFFVYIFMNKKIMKFCKKLFGRRKRNTLHASRDITHIPD
uniref:Seven transmembrane protein n=1 Tax=Clytia hemisphaerica TaxID=252671 RepID=A0A7M5UW68_9CNID